MFTLCSMLVDEFLCHCTIENYELMMMVMMMRRRRRTTTTTMMMTIVD